jgi:hypothetical protein
MSKVYSCYDELEKKDKELESSLTTMKKSCAQQVSCFDFAIQNMKEENIFKNFQPKHILFVNVAGIETQVF